MKRSRNAAGRGAVRLLVIIGLTLGLAATSPAQPDEEVLGPGDMVRITVFQNPDLTTETRVSAQGVIVFPLIGEVRLAGRTITEAGDVIGEALRNGRFVLDPQVSVSILEVRSRRVSVLGEVARPGQYALDGTSQSLTDILAVAGGMTEAGGDTVIVLVERDGQRERLEVNVPAMYKSGDLSHDVELGSGDTIFVPSAPVFYVYGAVQRAGEYRLKAGTSVHNALSLGGGLTPRGSERGIKIHRRMPDGSVETYDATPVDTLRENDVVYVEESLF